MGIASYIKFNIKYRADATTNHEKRLVYKFMKHGIYVESMANIRKVIYLRLVNKKEL